MPITKSKVEVSSDLCSEISTLRRLLTQQFGLNFSYEIKHGSVVVASFDKRGQVESKCRDCNKYSNIREP